MKANDTSYLSGPGRTQEGDRTSAANSTFSRPGTLTRLERQPLNLTGLFHLFVIYLVWGSTYLAIRIAVQQGSGFPPFALGASRTLLAGAILLLWAKFARQRVKVTTAELQFLLLSGLLLWVGGNGMVNWAEQRANSAFAALLISSTPIWVATLESFLDRRWPSLNLVVALAIGFAGIGVLTGPALLSGTRADALSTAAILVAALSWGTGSLLQRRRRIELSPLVSSAYQQLFGGLGFVVISLLAREPFPHPAPQAWWAWLYLVIFGSLFAFTSFIQALRLLPTSLVMTYAYVNPVIAVFLGWLILGEPVTAWTIAGATLVLFALAGIFRENGRNR